MAPPLIELRELGKKYPRRGSGEHTMALKSISLMVSEGESLGVCGESGAGKSSLARILLGLDSFDEGRMFVDGKEISGIQQQRRLHRFIQMVWQDSREYLNPYYSIAEHIIEPLQIFFPAQKAEFFSEAEALLASVGIPWHFAARRPHELSGGQCQRVSIARALAARPQVLVCDEALSGLDIPEQVRIIGLLADLQRAKSLTYIVIDHNLNVIRQLCSRLAVMRKGEIIEIGATEDLFNHPRGAYSRQLMQSFFALSKG